MINYQIIQLILQLILFHSYLCTYELNYRDQLFIGLYSMKFSNSILKPDIFWEILSKIGTTMTVAYGVIIFEKSITL